MKKEIQINYKKLNEIMSNEINEDDTNVFDNFKNIEAQLSNDIFYIAPNAYLVSGYRGVGKSTLIKRLENKLINEKKDDCIFININLSKYQETPLVIRKISRELYKSILKNDKHKKNIASDVKDKAKLLYMKTFFDVSDTYTLLEKLEVSDERTFTLNPKTIINMLLPNILLLFSLFISSTFMENNVYLNVLIVIISAIWNAITIKMVFKRKDITEDRKEQVIKSLYDDEIAEIELLELIEMLQNEGEIRKKIVLVIDEIDKIDDLKQINTLINELKPLVLSKHLYTIFITGQQLFYEHYFSNTKDDAVISSLFSKLFHVPIIPKKTFEKIFETIILNNEITSNTFIEYYINTKILESNRIPRRFFNLIIQDIEWKDDKAIICIDNDQEHYYKWVSDVLDILEEIESEINDNEYPKGLIDFIVNQHHNWIKKVISFGTSKFSTEMILETFDDSHPLKDYNAIVLFLDELLIKLIEKGKIEEVDREKNLYQIKFDKNLIKGFKGKSNSFSNEVRNQYYEKKFSLQDLIYKMYKNVFNTNEEPSIEAVLSELLEKDIIQQHYDYEIERIAKILNEKEIKNESNGIKNITTLKYFLIENYCFNIINKSLLPHGYKTKLGEDERRAYQSVSHPDVQSVHEEKDIKFLFEIKLTSTGRNIKSIIRNATKQLESYSEVRNNYKNVYNCIIIYLENNISIERFNRLEEEINQLDNRSVKVAIITDFNSRIIKEVVSTMLQEVETENITSF